MVNRLRFESYGFSGYVLRIMPYMVRVKIYGVLTFGLLVTGWRLHITGYEVRVTEYGYG